MYLNSILIYSKITYDALMKTTPLHPLSLLWKVREQCHRRPCSTVISSHCLAALPAKMSAFNSHMRQAA